MAAGFVLSFPLALSTWSRRPQSGPLDMAVLVFFSLILYAWFVQYDTRGIFQVARSVFDIRNWGKPLRLFSKNGRGGLDRKFFFFVFSWTGLAWLVFSFFSDADQAGSFLCPVASGLPFLGRQVPLFLLSLFFVLVFYVLKRSLVYGISHVLEEEKFASVIWRTGICHDLIFSILAVPLLSVSSMMEPDFQAWILRLVLSVFLILLIIKILHLSYEGRSLSGFSHLHIFVYLCALEILLPVCMWQAFFVYNRM